MVELVSNGLKRLFDVREVHDPTRLLIHRPFHEDTNRIGMTV
jgi:hypothetical protein